MIYDAYHDRVIIKKIDLEFKTKGGLFLGEIEKERETCFGRVVAVGKGKQVDSQGIIPTISKIGDIVVCNERIPIKMNIAGELLYFLRESDVIMRLEEEYKGEWEEVGHKTEGYEFAENGVKVLN